MGFLINLSLLTFIGCCVGCCLVLEIFLRGLSVKDWELSTVCSAVLWWTLLFMVAASCWFIISTICWMDRAECSRRSSPIGNYYSFACVGRIRSSSCPMCIGFENCLIGVFWSSTLFAFYLLVAATLALASGFLSLKCLLWVFLGASLRYGDLLEVDWRLEDETDDFCGGKGCGKSVWFYTGGRAFDLYFFECLRLASMV